MAYFPPVQDSAQESEFATWSLVLILSIAIFLSGVWYTVDTASANVMSRLWKGSPWLVPSAFFFHVPVSSYIDDDKIVIGCRHWWNCLRQTCSSFALSNGRPRLGAGESSWTASASRWRETAVSFHLFQSEPLKPVWAPETGVLG